MTGSRPRTMWEVFHKWVLVNRRTGCWIWTGNLHKDGYAFRSTVLSTTHLVHKWFWEEWYGPVPDGLELDHTCRVRCCVNPSHLEAVTHAVKMQRGTKHSHNKYKTHCPQGHPYEGDNLYINPRTGRRACRECHRTYEREKYRRETGLSI